MIIYIIIFYNIYIYTCIIINNIYICIIGVAQNYGTPKLHLRRPARSLPGKS